MRIRCDSCGKSYDNQKDEFCPNCGAYNEPLKGKGTLKDTYSHTLSEPKKAAVPRPVRPSKSQMPKPVKPKRKRPAAIGIFLIIALGAGFQLVNIFLADRDVKPDLDALMDNITISADGAEVSVSFSDGQDIDEWVNEWKAAQQEDLPPEADWSSYLEEQEKSLYSEEEPEEESEWDFSLVEAEDPTIIIEEIPSSQAQSFSAGTVEDYIQNVYGEELGEAYGVTLTVNGTGPLDLSQFLQDPSQCLLDGERAIFVDFTAQVTDQELFDKLFFQPPYAAVSGEPCRTLNPWEMGAALPGMEQWCNGAPFTMLDVDALRGTGQTQVSGQMFFAIPEDSYTFSLRYSDEDHFSMKSLVVQ